MLLMKQDKPNCEQCKHLKDKKCQLKVCKFERKWETFL